MQVGNPGCLGQVIFCNCYVCRQGGQRWLDFSPRRRAPSPETASRACLDTYKTGLRQ